MDNQRAFILDDKVMLVEAMPITDGTSFTNINIQPNVPYTITANTTAFAFLDLVDDKTSYTIETDNNHIQVSSPTYRTIYLPVASGLGGRQYYVSNNAPQSINVVAQPGDLIDKKLQIQLKPQSHAIFTSNSYNKWYMD